MSLIRFHIVLICSGILFAAIFAAVMALRHAGTGDAAYLVASVLSGCGALGLVLYLRRFLRGLRS